MIRNAKIKVPLPRSKSPLEITSEGVRQALLFAFQPSAQRLAIREARVMSCDDEGDQLTEKRPVELARLQCTSARVINPTSSGFGSIFVTLNMRVSSLGEISC